MTKHGNKIPDVTAERVRDQLADERDPKAIKRLTAAREYLAGLSPAKIEDKYGWHRQTIYNWLNRFEERDKTARRRKWRESTIIGHGSRRATRSSVKRVP